MPRNPNVPKDLPNGSVLIRVEVPEGIWQLSKALALTSNREPEECLRDVLLEVDGNIRQGRAGFLGPRMSSLVPDIGRALRFKQRAAQLASITNGSENFDIAKLDANPKMKSGFTGVFGNEQGFRAMAKDPKTGAAQFVGYYPSSLEAAWGRYLYHKEHNIPYGPWAALFELERVKNPQEPIEWAKKISAWNTGAEGKSSVGIPEEYMSYYKGEYPDINEEIDRAGLTHEDVKSPRSFGDVATATEEAVKTGKAKLAERLTKEAAEGKSRAVVVYSSPNPEPKPEPKKIEPKPQPIEGPLEPRDTVSDPSPEEMTAINKAAAKRMREIAEQKRADKRAARVATQPIEIELTEEEIIAMSTKG